LAKFCTIARISHPAVDELVKHLQSILVAEDLCAWDSEGTALAITGRGDPLPTSVMTSLPAEFVEPFAGLVERAVEVGIVDMYGVRTGEPARFLQECVNRLREVGCVCPVAGDLFGSNGQDDAADGWGLAMTQQEYEQFKSRWREVMAGGDRLIGHVGDRETGSGGL
jgi:hypothetical protein